MNLRAIGLLILVLGLVGCSGSGTDEPAAPLPVDEATDTLNPGPDGSDEISDADSPEDAADSEPTDARSVDPDAGAAAEEDPATMEEIAVRIYFPSNRGDGLISESRKILPSKNTEDRIKQILAHLLDGPTGGRVTAAVPKGTTLRQAYLASNGAAYVDFSAALKRGLNGGSMQETLTVYAIVNSVALNIRGVRSVGILVAGQPVESLNGHLDLRYPLRSNRDLLLR